jgi:hypothetical protein
LRHRKPSVFWASMQLGKNNGNRQPDRTTQYFTHHHKLLKGGNWQLTKRTLRGGNQRNHKKDVCAPGSVVFNVDRFPIHDAMSLRILGFPNVSHHMNMMRNECCHDMLIATYFPAYCPIKLKVG